MNNRKRRGSDRVTAFQEAAEYADFRRRVDAATDALILEGENTIRVHNGTYPPELVDEIRRELEQNAVTHLKVFTDRLLSGNFQGVVEQAVREVKTRIQQPIQDQLQTLTDEFKALQESARLDAQKFLDSESRLQAALSDREMHNTLLLKDKETLQKIIDSQSDDLSTLRRVTEENSNLQVRLAELKGEYDGLRSQFAAKCSDLENALAENKTLQEQLKIQDGKIGGLTNKLESTAMLNNTITEKDRHLETRDHLTKTQSELQRLHDDASRYKIKQKELEMSNTRQESEISQCKHQIAMQRASQTALEKINRVQDAKLQDLRSNCEVQLQSLQDLTSEKASILSDLQDARVRIEELTQLRNVEEKLLADAQRDSETALRLAGEEKQALLNTLDETLARSAGKCQKLQRTHQETLRSLHNAERQCRNYRLQCDEMNMLIQQLHVDIRDRDTCLEDLDIANTTTQLQVNDLQRQKADNLQDYAILAAQVTSLQSSLRIKSTECDQLAQRNDNLHRGSTWEIEQLQASLNLLELTSKDRDHQLEASRHEREYMNIEIDELHQAISRMQEQKAEVDLEKAQKDLEIQDMRMDLVSTRRKLDKEVSLRSERDLEISNLKRQMKLALEDHEETLSNVEKRLNNEMSLSSEREKEIKNLNLQAKGDADTHDALVTKLQNQLKVSEKDLTFAREELNHLHGFDDRSIREYLAQVYNIGGSSITLEKNQLWTNLIVRVCSVRHQPTSCSNDEMARYAIGIVNQFTGNHMADSSHLQNHLSNILTTVSSWTEMLEVPLLMLFDLCVRCFQVWIAQGCCPTSISTLLLMEIFDKLTSWKLPATYMEVGKLSVTSLLDVTQSSVHRHVLGRILNHIGQDGQSGPPNFSDTHVISNDGDARKFKGTDENGSIADVVVQIMGHQKVAILLYDGAPSVMVIGQREDFRYGLKSFLWTLSFGNKEGFPKSVALEIDDYEDMDEWAARTISPS